MVGFAYLLPEELPGVKLENLNRYLMTILLVPGEPEFSNQWGAYRVLSRLGRGAFYFPCPPWSDRQRNSMITKEDWEVSLLTKAPMIFLKHSFLALPVNGVAVSHEPGSMVHFEQSGGKVTLNVHPDDEAGLANLLEHMGTAVDSVIVIRLKPAETANMQLAWIPTETETCMNGIASAHTSSITGGFISIAIAPEMNHNGRFLEDGFFFSMATHAWAEIHRKLALGKNAAIPEAGPGGLSLSIKFLSNSNKPWWQFW